MSTTLQLVIVGIVIAVAVLITVYRVLKKLRYKDKISGCDCCMSNSSCPYSDKKSECHH